MKGFLLIATSHPYYGRMAANLALTIKAVSDLPIAVITDDIGLRHLDAKELSLFSHVIKTTANGEGLIGINKMRMNLPKLSPFKETLAMDVDTLWLPKSDPEAVFALLNDRDFTIVNEGYIDLDSGADSTGRNYTHWADPAEIKEAYGLSGKLWQVRGEFVLFRKGETVNKLYKLAREIQKAPKLDVQKLGGSVTDEFALNVAMNQVGIEPHEKGWHPAYWPAMHGNRIPAINALGGYNAISFGGNSLPREAQRIYGILAAGAANKVGLRYRFPLHAKRNFLKERLHS